MKVSGQTEASTIPVLRCHIGNSSSWYTKKCLHLLVSWASLNGCQQLPKTLTQYTSSVSCLGQVCTMAHRTTTVYRGLDRNLRVICSKYYSTRLSRRQISPRRIHTRTSSYSALRASAGHRKCDFRPQPNTTLVRVSKRARHGVITSNCLTGEKH